MLGHQRQATRLVLLALALASAVCLVAPWLLMGQHDAWVGWLPPWCAPEPVVGASIAGLVLLSVFGPGLLVVLLRRRRGAVAAVDDELVFEVALGPRVRIRREAIAFQDDVSAGVIARVPSRGWAAEWIAPLLVPAADEAARVDAHALLDRGAAPLASAEPRHTLRPMLVVIAGIGLPTLALGVPIRALERMMKDVGVEIPALTDAALRGLPTISAVSAAMLALFLWGGTRLSRQVLATLLVLCAWLALTAYAMVLPLITLNRPL